MLVIITVLLITDANLNSHQVELVDITQCLEIVSYLAVFPASRNHPMHPGKVTEANNLLEAAKHQRFQGDVRCIRDINWCPVATA